MLACDQPRAQQDCAPDPKSSQLFVSDVASGMSSEVMDALNAGRLLENVAKQQVTFDQKMIAIAKDAKLSEEWAKVMKLSGDQARTTAETRGLAVDVPLQATRLRAAGVPNEEVVLIVDAAEKVRLPTADLASVMLVAAKSAEADGPIEDVGHWLTQKIEAGVRGEQLAKEVAGEHRVRGRKKLEAEVAAGKKVTICHRPPGNPENAKTIEVGVSALAAHLAHGDTEGPCDGTEKDKGKPEDPGEGKGKDDKGKPDDPGKADGKGKPEEPGKPADKGPAVPPGKPAEPGKADGKGKGPGGK
jgi:hypothetical protein